MCSGFKPKARFYGLLGLKNRHFYAVPGTAGKSSSADKPRGSAEALENSRISMAVALNIQMSRHMPHLMEHFFLQTGVLKQSFR